MENHSNASKYLCIRSMCPDSRSEPPGLQELGHTKRNMCSFVMAFRESRIAKLRELTDMILAPVDSRGVRGLPYYHEAGHYGSRCGGAVSHPLSASCIGMECS